ncbi:PH domain-containing protein [Sinomonas atrocyanea]|uniref:PH domain-containing protein n=1 Tax=Sinomonas atrocyanea TaxID=37927 RepID=UPI003D95BB73
MGNQQIPRSAHDGEWRRVHPLSPWVRGWILVAALFVAVGRDWFEALLSGGVNRGWWSGVPVPVLAAVGIGVVVLVAAGFMFSWWTTRFAVGATTVRLRTGIVFRQLRQARLDRVQAVDLAQPLLARLFGLAELRFEVADAGESALRLSFLPVAEAEALRARILAAAAAARSAEQLRAGDRLQVNAAPLPGARREAERVAPEVPADPGEALVAAVPLVRILASTLLTPFVMVASLAGAASVALQVATGVTALGVALVPAFLAAAATAWGRINRTWNFRVLAAGDGLRLRYGLLETRTQTVPAGRVQAIGIRQPLLWRPFGWWALHVNVAGYGQSSGQEEAKSTVLPAGTLEDVFRVLGLVFPDPGAGPESARGVVQAGMTGAGSDGGFASSPGPARWVDPLGWRRTGFLATGTAILCRHGAFARTLSIVPHGRTQSVALTQGPLERRFGLANVELHSTPGPVRPAVRHLAVADAERLFGELAARAAAARRRAPGAAPLARQHPPVRAEGDTP